MYRGFLDVGEALQPGKGKGYNLEMGWDALVGCRSLVFQTPHLHVLRACLACRARDNGRGVG